MEHRKIADNVLAFLDRTCADVAKVEAEHWSQSNFCALIEGPIESPIEQLFYLAVRALCRGMGDEFNPNPDYVDGKVVVAQGVYLDAQQKIGKYRVDFVLSQFDCGPPDDVRIVIELDGHAFHDKDKHQRAYEKARDRFLVRQGYKVLHYTGAEVVADPYAVAHEALLTLGMAIADDYDPQDPMGLGL